MQKETATMSLKLLKETGIHIGNTIKRWRWEGCEGSEFPPTERDALEMILASQSAMCLALAHLLEDRIHDESE